MTVRAPVNPRLITWAAERSGAPASDLTRRFPKLQEWERGERVPTLRQLEDFARATHTPVGMLFLDEPPEERIPIPDFRTMGDAQPTRPSPDLLDTIFQCQQRQDWYRSYARVNQARPAEFVGSLSPSTDALDAAATIRTALNFEVDRRASTFVDTIRVLVEGAEDLGVLVMVNGVVGSNTHRKLDPREFRGFALADELAPLIFVNGADTKAAQLFTIAHELTHLWLGQTALSDADLTIRPTVDVERWCNRVAAEILVPLEQLNAEYRPDADLTDEVSRLGRRFKASTLVILRRIYDGGHLPWDEYRTAYGVELERLLVLLGERASGGGNFYNTQPTRTSRRFARALIADTLEGRTLYTEAFGLLGFKKLATFNEMAARLGVG
jgi:Zn-dependent peptidase ImmA (M78 family)